MFIITCLLMACTAQAVVRVEQALPLLDQTIKKKDQVHLEVVQNQMVRYWLSPQSKITNLMPKQCHIHPAYISVGAIAQLNVQHNQLAKMYSFNKDKRALYQLTDRVITKYVINWQQGTLSLINKLTFNDYCGKDMIQEWQQQKLYIFLCDRIYKLNHNLSLISQIKRKEGNFSSLKVVRYRQYIFEVSSNQGINIYSIDVKAQIELVGSIKTYQNHSLHISDIFLSNDTLYVLDYKQGIYMYELEKSRKFIQKDKIQFNFKQPINYKLLLIHQNNLYLTITKTGQSIVAEYALINHIPYLIRYYKGYSHIDKISIFQNKLLIQSQSKIQLLPINRDPRIISQLNNGYAYTHDIQIQELNYLQDSKFLISSPGLLQVVGWNIREESIECVFEQTGNQLIRYLYPCGVNLKNKFYQICQYQQQIVISVIPSHRDNYFWLLLIVIGIFIFGVISLIFWRQHQTQQINKLIRKIKQYKQKFKPKKQQIQFEQVQHAYSIDLRSQSDEFKRSLDRKQAEQEQIKQQKYIEINEDTPQSQRKSFTHT